MSATLPGEFDGYRIERQIGSGGMGRVYLGHDTLLDRPVAIKFISSAHPTPEARRRFLVEARAVARLQHPCVVAVYRVGETDGLPYIVSEFVPGDSLDRLAPPVQWEQALRMGYDLARGLAVAHQAGVIHRDIKPANAILTSDRNVKLLDFGVARLLERGGSDHQETNSGRASQAPPALAGLAAPEVTEAEPEVAVSQTVAVQLPVRLSERTDAGADLEAQPGPRHTLLGHAVGTPAYMAPEVWEGEAATCASDVYSLGALLFYLCTGQPPHTGTSLEALRKNVTEEDAEPLCEVAPGVQHAFGAVVDRCLRRDHTQRYVDGNDVRAALEPLVSPGQRRKLAAGNPYRGLRAFEAEHEGLFFARDSEIRAVLDRLSNDPAVIVCGDSGVGKSSLCRAGILPRVAERLGDDLRWSSVIVVPGRRPVAALCIALSAHLDVSEEALANALADGPSTFGREIRGALGSGRGLVLFIDQLEEILTQAGQVEAETVARLFSWTGNPAPGFRILASLRGDFLGRLAAAPGMGDAFPSVLYFLRPLSAERVREAVMGPAEATGFRFETKELVDALVESAAGSAGALPLLQFALRELWERRDGKLGFIPAAALEQMGGVTGALSMHADEILSGLEPRRRAGARRILMRLVTPAGTRARRSAGELTADTPGDQPVLDALVRGRLVSALESPEGPLFELAHEALLRGWKTLVHWLSADAEGRVVRERLAHACKEWKRLDRSSETLWRGRQLGEGEAVDPTMLSEDELAFLGDSRRRERRARFTRRFAVAAVLLGFLAVWGGMRMKATTDHTARVDGKLSIGMTHLAKALSLGKKLDSAKRQSYLLFDQKERERGEEAWDNTMPIRAEYQAALGRASREFEAAVALESEREDSKAVFARTLFLRALEAEQRSADSERSEFLRRMSLYDVGEKYERQWDAPGTVTVSTVPPKVDMRVERYVEAGKGRLELREVEVPVSLPAEGFSLPPGSYRLVLSAAGRKQVVRPFVMKRGEVLKLDVRLPPTRSLPAGFVFVPGGRFLFGSAQEDGLRRGFHHTVPIHEVETGPFLIAQNETTFAQWIEYLDALPEEQRAQRLPSVHTGGFEGAVGLNKRASYGPWEFTFKPSSTRYVAAAGERLVYQGRGRRTTQDWLSFPVVGITAADSEAYTKWLNDTGRLPGARLCTDLEWEFAARGADGRQYPHGNRLWPDDSNYDDTYSKVPEAMGLDEVGSHPASRSPFGLDDMSGNVWEWVTSSLDADGHAARGGSFYFDINCAKTLNRETPEPSFRDASVGFRICADPPANLTR